MKKVNVAIIGGGLMGREAASAFARWFVLKDMPVQPVLYAIADLNPALFDWYKQIETVKVFTTNYHEVLADPNVEVVYVAVPHNLHLQIYTDVLRAGKDLIAEKPFGIDLASAQAIIDVINETGRFVRCSSEFPFFPGAQRVMQMFNQGDLGEPLEIVSTFHHASDLDPSKPINWKRQTQFCGQIGVMADLGMHVAHVPLRLGLMPTTVYAQLQKIYTERPDGKGGMAACDTFDNAILHTNVTLNNRPTPMRWEMKRMAPGATNTWSIEILGTDRGARFSTTEPKTLWLYERKKEQWWSKTDLGFTPPIGTITGGIFEVGFPDAFQQMLAAYFLERETGSTPFPCATPNEALASHKVFAAAYQSHQNQSVVRV